MTAALIAGVDLQPVREFLACATPRAWVLAAARPANEQVLLVDHARRRRRPPR